MPPSSERTQDEVCGESGKVVITYYDSDDDDDDDDADGDDEDNDSDADVDDDEYV